MLFLVGCHKPPEQNGMPPNFVMPVTMVEVTPSSVPITAEAVGQTEGAKEVWITERGTSFGYNTLVVDYTGLQYMLEHYDVPCVFDVTHAVQKPGGNGESSGGNRDYVPGLARAAAAMGINDFFIEVHADPDDAPSDGPNMLRLEDFEKVVKDIIAIRKAVE